MDQDELEDEIFTKTIGIHLTMLIDYTKAYSLDISSLLTITHRREFFIYCLAVIVAILVWVIHSGVIANRFELFNSFLRGFGSLDNRKFWQETDQSGTASGNLIIIQRNKS